MLRAMLNEILGPMGRAALAFYFANQGIINIIFVVWAVIMTYASYQMTKIRRMTVLLSDDYISKNPNLSNEQIWKIFRPIWQSEISNLNPRIIPNMINLWITRPTPEKLIQSLRLGPDWFEAIRNGEVLLPRYHPGRPDRLASFKK